MKLTRSNLRPSSKEAVVRKVSVGKDLQQVVQQQASQIAAQQKQIDSLIAAMNGQGGGPKDIQKKVRRCWLCDSTDHVKRNCPKNNEASAVRARPKEVLKQPLN